MQGPRWIGAAPGRRLPSSGPLEEETMDLESHSLCRLLSTQHRRQCIGIPTGFLNAITTRLSESFFYCGIAFAPWVDYDVGLHLCTDRLHTYSRRALLPGITLLRTDLKWHEFAAQLYGVHNSTPLLLITLCQCIHGYRAVL